MDTLMTALSDRLAALHRTIDAALDGLPDEALDWVPGPDMNSLGVLLAHTLGSQRYWIGDIAGQDPSGRVRAKEFETAGVGAAAFRAKAGEVLSHSQDVLARMTAEQLAQTRAVPDRGQQTTSIWAILYALEHTAQHAGHIEITRQLWEQRGG